MERLYVELSQSVRVMHSKGRRELYNKFFYKKDFCFNY